VIVSTPQEVAWEVAQKAILMFDKLNVPIIGVVENMSYFKCSHCNEREEIFGSGGAKSAAAILELPFLGSLPLDTKTRINSDRGEPIVVSEPDSAITAEFLKIAKYMVENVKTAATKSESKVIPKKVSVSDKAEIMIEWSDGNAKTYSSKTLRYLCPCA
jgi:ATP-binding protein involved in chromosome partitioning